jgi:Nucleotidyltransferase domain.
MSLDEVIRERAVERERVIRGLRIYADRLRIRLGGLTMILYGSYARGDFNLWSDVDVLIISEYFRGRNFVTRCIILMMHHRDLNQYVGHLRKPSRHDQALVV